MVAVFLKHTQKKTLNTNTAKAMKFEEISEALKRLQNYKYIK